MKRDPHSGRRESCVGEFLADDEVVPEIVNAASAILLRRRHGEESGGTGCAEQRPVDDACFFPSLEVRCNLPIDEGPEGIPEHLVLFVEDGSAHAGSVGECGQPVRCSEGFDGAPKCYSEVERTNSMMVAESSGPLSSCTKCAAPSTTIC
ncbi:unannotated protein [freshwater metagenome]|uniref:Unannotated protein n=1 Tax=freshwater metagenome TaxID=449393 RepID=A0A6J7JLJ8_9ZZZZ